MDNTCNFCGCTGSCAYGLCRSCGTVYPVDVDLSHSTHGASTHKFIPDEDANGHLANARRALEEQA